MEAYCIRCKRQRPIADAEVIVMKNGKPAVKGACAVCGTKVFKIGGIE